MTSEQKNYLILIVGLPGTGKSTLAGKIAEKLGNYTLIDQNELRRQAGIKKMPKNQDSILRQIDRMTAESLNNSKGVIVDSVHRYSFRRQQLYGVASGCGKEVLLIECVCSAEEAKKRMKQRLKSDGLLSDPNNTQVYDKLANLWEDITNHDFKYKGSDHVSYIIYNSEINQIEAKKMQKGIRPLLNMLNAILTEKNTIKPFSQNEILYR